MSESLSSFLLPVLISTVTAVVLYGLSYYLPTRKEKLAKQHTGAVLAPVFEQYAIRCSDLIATYQFSIDSGGAAGYRSMNLPEFSTYPSELDYSLISGPILSRALAFTNLVELSSQKISFMGDVDRDLVGNEVYNHCGILGDEAIRIAKSIREDLGLPFPDYYNQNFDLSTLLAEVAGEAYKEQQN